MQNEIIHFRSYTEERNHTDTSSRMKKGRGLEIAEIRRATLEDDTRDILWKRGERNGEYTSKDRSLERGLKIVVLKVTSFDSYKNLFFTATEERLLHSCAFYHVPIRQETGEMSVLSLKLESMKLENTLVFVLISSLSENDYKGLLSLSRSNDMIFISHFYSYELSGNTGLYNGLIAGSRYRKAMKEQIECLGSIARKKGAHLIPITEEDSLAMKLNDFFKHRYG